MSFPVILVWAHRLARLIALGLGVYVCFLVLAIFSLPLDSPNRIAVDKVTVHGRVVTLSGRTQPLAWVEVFSGERRLTFSQVNPRGRFAAAFEMPPEAHRIWLRAFAERSFETELAHSEPIPIRAPEAQVPPRITLAYFLEEARTLWVAGHGFPESRLRVDSAEAKLLGFQVDAAGCFDVLIPIPPDREAPESLFLARGEEERRPGEGQAAFTVTRVPPAKLPLARTADIEIRDQARMKVRVTLPAAHPYFSLLEKGWVTAKEFGRATFNADWPKAKLVSLKKSGAEGTVEIDMTWPDVALPEVYWFAGEGIGRFPLLTAKDKIVVRLTDVESPWFGDPLPSRIENGFAVWQGPIEDPRPDGKVLQVGRGLSDLTRLKGATPRGRQEEEEKPKEETFRDFIRRLSGLGGATLQSIWYLAVSLIPFAGLIWLGTRRPRAFGSPELWRALTATALVLALWRIVSACIPFFDRLAGLLGEIPRTYETSFEAYSTIYQSSWLAFALFAAAFPRLWSHLAQQDLSLDPVPEEPRSRIRRFGSWIRWSYVAAMSLLYLVIAKPFLWHELLQSLPLELQAAETWGLGLTACFCLVLLGFGLRAFLMGAGFALVVLWHYSKRSADVAELAPLAELPRWLLLGVAVLAVCPFLFFLVRKLTRSFLERRSAVLLTAALVASALLVPHLPARITLTLTGSLLVFGFAGILLRLSIQAEPSKPWARKMASWHRGRRAILLFLSVLLAWPLTDSATKLELWQAHNLNQRVQSLLFYVFALGVILLLREYARRHTSPTVERATLGMGIYLFAVLLINGYSSWLLLPVPFLVALLIAGTWLFRPEEEVERLRNIPEAKLKRQRRLIQDVVDSSTSGAQFAVIQKSLAEKLNKAELTPEEYEAKLNEYRVYLDKKLELETVAPEVSSQEAVFAVGGEDLWSNVAASVKTGAVLAAGPFLIALYQVLPTTRASYPYPLLSLLTFILSAATPWLLYAFFFGFFFPYLRGKSGLAKGINLFFALLIPFAAYRLLDAQSLTDMRLFILWATQLFLFCTLLGLVAFDYRLLRNNKFRVRDLTAVHNVPALSAYASTAVAALVPTVIALITGKFGEIVKFFLETVLGKTSGS